MSQYTPGKDSPTPEANAKLEISSDIIAFFSIIASYGFMSISTRSNYFQQFLNLKLDNPNDIAFLFLLYVFIIVLIKFAAWILIKSKKQGVEKLTTTINQSINYSTFIVLLITALCILISAAGSSLGIEKLCHISIWLLFAQLNRLFCALISPYSVSRSFAIFGQSLEIIMGLGLLGGLFVNIDFFDAL